MTIYKYGTKVRDKLTGTQGVVTAYGYYYGRQVDVYRVEYMSDTKSLNVDWIDADRLEALQEITPDYM